MLPARLCTLLLCLLPLAVLSQPIRTPLATAPGGNQSEADGQANTPLIFRSAGDQPTLEDVVTRLRAEMRAVAQSSLSAAEKQAAGVE